MRKPRSPRRPQSSKARPGSFAGSPRATLVFLAVVGLLLWGRLLLKEVPQTASAVDPPTSAEGVAADAAGPDGEADRPEERAAEILPPRPPTSKVGP